MPNDNDLHLACMRGEHHGEPLTKVVLEKLVEVHGLDCQGTYDRTGFVFAATGGKVETMQMLKQMGAKVAVRNKVS